MSEKENNEETINPLSNTNIGPSELILQDINTFKNKNLLIISKDFEIKIPDILSFLQNNANLAVNKIILVKYLQTLFLTIDINSEIFLRKLSSEEDKLNLFQIIFHQYISYTNSSNSLNDENTYREELLELFNILLTQVTIDRESYHYILSFLLKYINEKNNNESKLNPNKEEQKIENNLTAEHLGRILILLQKFYQFLDETKLSLNYFFFSGEENSSITIQNKNSSKDNKKILNMDDNLCILLFIKVFPSEYIKTLYNTIDFNLLELRFNEKNKDKNIFINIDINNNLTTNFTSGPIAKLSEVETNWVLIKFKRKKKIKVKMYLNGRKIYYKKDKDKEKEKEKEEIKEIVLFKNFIGICYNFMIFKTKKKREVFPKLLENEVKINNLMLNSIITPDDNKMKVILPANRTRYYNGFSNEELIYPFIKTELKDEIEQNILNNLYDDNNFSFINSNDIKDLMEKLISVYMPSRVIIPPTCKNNTLMDTPHLILQDAINGLDAEFITKNPALNGVHIYKRIVNDFAPIGGLNNLLPIMELMTKNKELLTKQNFGNFFDMLISIFAPQYQNALVKENNNNFFMYLSFFLEKIPDDFYDSNLTGIFKTLSCFLTTQINENYDFSNYIEQFHNYILINEKILFKFNHAEQKEIIEMISYIIETIDSDKKGINIDTIKIIKILLHLDENKNKLFCCKKHSEYFIENFGIMSPELSQRLQPIEELLNLLFKDFKEKVNNNDPYIKVTGKNLYKLFTLLTYDISPCIQKMIIRLFSSFLDNNYDKYLYELDQGEQLLNISLFIFKSSIFDIKQDILNLIFIILKSHNINKEASSINENKYTFITSNILPFFLFEDKELLKITTTDNNDNIKSSPQDTKKDSNNDEKTQNDTNNSKEIPIIYDYIENEIEKDNNLNKDKETKEDILMNEIYGEDDLDNSKNRINGIKINTIINDVKYSLPLVDKYLNKIHSIYNKAKLKSLINNLFNITYKFFHEGVSIRLCLNLLTKIVAKGDLLLVSSFLEKLQSEISNNKTIEYKKKLDEINNNKNLLQWLIETCFQATLINETKLDKTIFVPGFDLDVETIDNEGNSKKLDDKEKIGIIKNIIKMSNALLKNIFKNNIYNMDYIFTWSKYYYELRNETNNFKSVRELILEFMIEVGYNTVIDCTNPDIMNNIQQKMTAYFFNLLFEFVTFYKIKQEDLNEYQTDSSIYQGLYKNLKHILISKMDDGRHTLKPIDEQDKIDSKFDEYPFFKTIFDFWTPLWKGENKQNRQESDIYSKYISNKKNININELELLFYNFHDINEFKDEKTKNIYVNKGIPLIYVMYHFFTLIFSIGGTEIELRELFFEFRLFILLLIISSSTLTTPGIGKKKKWPSDEQYKNAQITIEAVLFNFLYFLIQKIKDIKEKIKDFKETEQSLDNNEESYLNYLNQINKLLIENLGYFLKILNKIYREIKKEDDKSNAGFGAVGSFFKGIKFIFFEYEGVKKSGGFKLIEKMYSECSNLSSNPNEKNMLDKITDLNFIDKDYLINSKSTIDNKDQAKNKLFIKLEEYIFNFIEDSQILQFFEKHNEEYRKLLFPFVSFISARRDAIKNIIPVYDNRPNITSYPRELCLIPDYFPENTFDSTLIQNIESINKNLTTDLQLLQKKIQMDEEYKSHNYKKEKEKLFSFTGIWSIKDFFYNKKDYRLKYRLLNHMSDDFTRVLLTPIIDINYYLPQFSKFDPINLFRNISKYKSVCRAADLSFGLKKVPPFELNDKKDNKNKNKNEKKDTPVDNSKNNESSPKSTETTGKEDNKIEEENKIKEDENKNALYYIGKENYNFIDDNEKSEETFQENLFMNYIQKKHFIQLDKYCIQANACFVKLAFHVRGIIFNNDKGIGFYSFESKRKGDEEDYDSDRKVCFGSVFRSQMAKYSYFFIEIPYNKIQFILRRRYFFKKIAIEIFTEDRKSYFFKIEETKFKSFVENIKYYMKQDIEDIFIEYNKYDDKIGFVNKNNIFLNTNMHLLTNEKKYMNLKTLYEKWSKWEISTLKMIMIMNLYSNRSYNDSNQYPVFPWIITDYLSEKLPSFDKENFIRPMNKPMGMMDFTEDSKERKENYEQHWLSNEADPDRDDNYDRYGSHYSTSLYLTYYLVRVFPYSYIRIELQGKNFDDPNRLFNSLPDSFDCAISQKSDLRELIPEFFCFPEMFLNMNELNLGEISDGKGSTKLVGGVKMPIWANYNEYIFVGKHRELLESSEINEKINEWFNIIFGSKQKGKEAKKIGNLFISQTYEDFDEIYNKGSKSEKTYQCRMVEFGVTPNQLFKYDTYKRQNINDISRIKRNLLFNVLQKKNKKAEQTGKELDLEEIKVNIEENISKMFIFIVKKKDKKKERIYLLTNNKVKIYTKYDKNQFFKTTLKDKDKDKTKEKQIENDNKDEDKEDIKEEQNETIDNDIKDNEIHNELSNSINNIEKQKENEKITGKEQSKINVYSKYERKYVLPKYRMNFNDSPTILYEEGFYIAFGGFWNGDIIIKHLIESDAKKNKNKKIKIIRTWELSPITKIIMDKTETLVICCNLDGTVFIYIIDQNDKLIWHPHKVINEGQGEISSIALNENLNIFIVCYKNGYCMVYTLPNCKLFNSFTIEENDLNSNIILNKDNNDPDSEQETTPMPLINKTYSPDITFISNSPLPCYIFYIKERKSLCIYSINAHFLNEFILGYEIVRNGIKKFTDHCFKDYLFIYNIINNTIDIHRLIDLNLVISSPVIDSQFVDFQFTKDMDYAFILTKVKQKNDDKAPLHKMLLLKQAPSDTSKNQYFNF